MKTIEFTKPENMMPAEVATELLRTPGTRLSARMRKECWAARAKVISSLSPIRRAATGGYETNDEQVRRDFPTKCMLKFEKLGAAKLVQMVHTTLRRRLAVQRPFLMAEDELAKMQADTTHAAIVKNARRYNFITALLRRLADEANRLDIIAEALEEEISSRRLNVKRVPAVYVGKHFKKLCSAC